MTDVNEATNETRDRVPYEDWSREHLIQTVKKYEEGNTEKLERIAAQKEMNEKLNAEIERWKSKPISEVLAGFIRATVREMDLDTVVDAAIDRSDIDADNIYNLDDRVEEKVRDLIGDIQADDVSGLDDMIDERVSDKLRDTSIEIEAKLVC